MREEKNTSAKNVGFPGALFLVLLVLKCTNQIGTSWVLITAPLWAPLGLIAMVLLAVGLAEGVTRLIRGCHFPKRAQTVRTLAKAHGQDLAKVRPQKEVVDSLTGKRLGDNND